MPITINGNGAISGLGDIDGHDLETATLVVSGDTTIAPQAVGRASLFVDDSTNSVGINTTTPAAAVFLEVADATDPIVSLNNTGNGEVRLGCTAARGYIGTESNHPFDIEINSSPAISVLTNGNVGINDTSPDFRLDIVQPSSAGSQQILRLTGGEYTGNFTTGLDIYCDSSAANGNRRLRLTCHAQSGFRFQPYETNTGNPAVDKPITLCADGGNVGIGVTNPAADLQVNPHPNTNIGTQSLFVAGTKSHFANHRGLPQNQLVIYDDAAATARSGGAIGFCANAGPTQQTWLASIESERDNNSADGSNYGGSLVFYTRPPQAVPIEAARFNSTGNLAFPNGQGIDFSAVQGPGATSRVLDDYEEGTWTPVLGRGSSTPLNSADVSYLRRNGTYIKIGATVFFTMDMAASVAWNNITSNSDNFIVMGLPYASSQIGPPQTGPAFPNFGFSARHWQTPWPTSQSPSNDAPLWRIGGGVTVLTSSVNRNDQSDYTYTIADWSAAAGNTTSTFEVQFSGTYTTTV